jgi:hypothetical protein
VLTSGDSQVREALRSHTAGAPAAELRLALTARARGVRTAIPGRSAQARSRAASRELPAQDWPGKRLVTDPAPPAAVPRAARPVVRLVTDPARPTAVPPAARPVVHSTPAARSMRVRRSMSVRPRLGPAWRVLELLELLGRHARQAIGGPPRERHPSGLVHCPGPRCGVRPRRREVGRGRRATRLAPGWCRPASSMGVTGCPRCGSVPTSAVRRIRECRVQMTAARTIAASSRRRSGRRRNERSRSCGRNAGGRPTSTPATDRSRGRID